MKKEKSCGAVIFNDMNEVLLIKHIKGHWSFPKGHVEGNEQEIETALREIKEETNLDVIIDEKVRFIITYNPKENISKDVVYFKAKTLNDNVILQNEEVLEYKWISYEEAINLVTFDNDRTILEKIYNNTR